MVVQQQNLAVIPCCFRQELYSYLHALTNTKSPYGWLYRKWAVGNTYTIIDAIIKRKCQSKIKAWNYLYNSMSIKSALTRLFYLHVLSWNLASHFPMFRTNRVLWDKHLTGQNADYLESARWHVAQLHKWVSQTCHVQSHK